MTIFARVTRPLRPLDRSLLRMSDSRLGRARWMWWPSQPPRRDRPWGAGQHGVYLAWSVVGFLIGEVAARKQSPEGPRSLRRDRVVNVVSAVVLWAGSAGAWDRRAAELRRRPWRRLGR